MATSLNIPVGLFGGIGGQGPTPARGQVRYNTSQHRVETWSGAQWIPIAQAHEYPETWQEWWDYYCKQDPTSVFFKTEGDRKSIERNMQERYPGNYQVGIDIVNDKWIMMFDTPEDETWFNLQYT